MYNQNLFEQSIIRGNVNESIYHFHEFYDTNKGFFVDNSPNDFIYLELHGNIQVVDRRDMVEAGQTLRLLWLLV